MLFNVVNVDSEDEGLNIDQEQHDEKHKELDLDEDLLADMRNKEKNINVKTSRLENEMKEYENYIRLCEFEKKSGDFYYNPF